MTEFDEMWSIMGRYQFRIEKHLLVDIMCIICNKLLIDAYQGPCGCNYCKKCIETHLESRGNICPGNTRDCLIEELLMGKNIVKDNRANRRISTLKVKCPSELCEFQGDLIKIFDHLRLCDKKSIMCPLNGIGCPELPIQYDKISSHLLDGLYEHSVLLVQTMINIKNGNVTLNENKDNLLKKELNSMVDSINVRISQLLVKDRQDKIEKDNEYKKMEKDIDKLNKQIHEIWDCLKEIEKLITKNTDQSLIEVEKIIKTEMNRENENESLKEEKETILTEINEYKKEKETLKREISEYRKRNASLSSFPDPMKMKSSLFEWKIENLEAKRSSSEYVKSNFFYSTDKVYQMNLCAHANGCKSKTCAHIGSYFCVGFFIGLGSSWPFKGNVSVTIVNKTNNEKNYIITKYFEIDQSNYKYFSKNDFNYYFHFLNTDIDRLGLIRLDSMRINCDIDYF